MLRDTLAALDQFPDEAEQLEHAVSADFERRLIERLGTGEACPHGNHALMTAGRPASARLESAR